MYDVIIIGSGPAGLTAAIYAVRADLKTLVLAGRTWGGQLMLTTTVENYPGFPEGIMGPTLMTKMREQAKRHGAEIKEVNFAKAKLEKSPFLLITDDKEKLLTKSVIIATGAQTKWLDVPGEKEKIGHGVSSCAPCDAAFYRGKNVIVVGGGDSAMEEALVLTKFASMVTVVHRRSELRASKIMQKKAKDNPKINFLFNAEVLEILGEDKVEKVKLCMRPSDKKLLLKTGKELEEIAPKQLHLKVLEHDKQSLIAQIPIDGVFVAVGHMPNSVIFPGIETDKEGFIKIFEHTKTNIDGVFVAGDVHDSHYKQAVTAAGFGCAAALEAEKWLRMEVN
ncbi:MAG: hypothetical protein A2857_03075 [Candidatus Levybacteria bacterium RIFCSPHIGHO2_01_FULL_36_15]|nr:MAG: hypothetical protein A2857_03075 [Candidatus Levybacteria bacterium RIFCSPHIGHO2_01_FULL_36_15]OGH38234.1 MAG: hypothetical protein A2905_03305 [Candidatus Levybacteria bacterium RIFCSPLOWO2_01_FULL_36_10]